MDTAKKLAEALRTIDATCQAAIGKPVAEIEDRLVRISELCLRTLSTPAAADAPEPVALTDPMDWPLPCDVTVGHGTMRKGVALRTLVTRMKVLYEMATGNNADEVAARTPEQRAALAASQPAPVEWSTPDPRFVRLAKAAVDLIAAVDENHATKEAPLKYTVPWGAVVNLRNCIDGSAPVEAQAVPVDLIDNIAAKVSGGLCSTTMEGKHAFLRDILALIAAAPTPSKG